VGMNSWEPLMRIVSETDVDVVMLAGRWTLLDRSGEPLLEECLRRGVAVIAAAPFNSGLLAHSWPPEGASFDYRETPQAVLNQARTLARICQSHGVSLPHVAVSFPLRHPAVVSVVAGVRNSEEARAVASWVASPIPGDVWDDLSQASARGMCG
jgi:D-threo-aldose 1-dehydrogenase